MKKIVMILAVGMCFLTGCEKEKKEDTGLSIHTFDTDKVSVESMISDDHKLMMKIKNEDTVLVDLLDIDVAFYKEEELLKTGEAFLKNVDAGLENYVAIELPKDSKGNIIDPTKIDIKVHKNIYEKSSVTNYTEKISASYKIDETDKQKINVEVKNTSGVVLNEVEVALVFKKNDKMVSMVSTYLLNVKEAASTVFYVPSIVSGNSAKYITYDKIDVVVNHASKNK